MMQEAIAEIGQEAKRNGLALVVWSYARGDELSSKDETAVDVVSYGAHMACLLGANIVKVKFPTNHISNLSKGLLKDHMTPEQCVDQVVKSSFNGKRIVIFSGGGKMDDETFFNQVRAIAASKANGSIVGRNLFQRTLNEARSDVKADD